MNLNNQRDERGHYPCPLCGAPYDEETRHFACGTGKCQPWTPRADTTAQASCPSCGSPYEKARKAFACAAATGADCGSRPWAGTPIKADFAPCPNCGAAWAVGMGQWECADDSGRCGRDPEKQPKAVGRTCSICKSLIRGGWCDCL